jgi:hypothetical protein
MSIYERRVSSAYGSHLVGTGYADNKFILKWWSASHDHLLSRLIAEKQWAWNWSVTDEIVAATDPVVIDAWKQEDPLCSQYAWYNVLMYFAASRAEKIGLTSSIRVPRWKTCPLCKESFVESSLPLPIIERLGIDHLDYCAPCLKDIILPGTGSDKATAQEIKDYLVRLAHLISRVPTQDFGANISDIEGITPEDRFLLFILLQGKPSLRRVKALFDSWLVALIDSGVLEDGTRLTSRGIQTLAKDRHVCLSLGEKTIDDFLFDNGIPHEKEPKYPSGNYRADFLVNGVLIEYFGLAGNAEYDAKTRIKTQICQEWGIELISIFPIDLVSNERLRKKLLPVLPKEG